MMGVIILTADDKKYRQGDYVVMHREMTNPPTAPGTTYILHTKTFPESEIISWFPLVAHRLVVVLPKPPSLSAKSENMVIVDSSLRLQKQSFRRNLQALFQWSDRGKALSVVSELPIPLALAFFKVNRVNDIESARRLSKVQFFLPDEYAIAVLTYSAKPNPGQVVWPTKSKKEQDKPSRFRLSDEYSEIIIEYADEVSNMIRSTEPKSLPANLPKKQRRLLEWL